MKSLILALGIPFLAPAVHAGDDAGEVGDAFVLYSAGLDDVLADPLDAGVRKAVRLLAAKALHGADGASDEEGAPSSSWLADLLTRPLSLRVRGAAEKVPLRARFVVELRNVEEARRWTRTLDAWLMGRGLRFRTVDTSGLTMTRTPIGSLFFGVDRANPAPNLTIALGDRRVEPLELKRTGLPEGMEPVAFVHVDGRGLAEPLAAVVSLVGRGEELLRLARLVDWIGENSRAHSFAIGYRGEEAVAVSRSSDFLPDGRSGAFYSDRRIEREDFRMIPTDATLARLFGMNPGAIFSMLNAAEPGFGALAREEVRRLTGVDLQEHLFKHLGDVGGYYWAESTGGGGLLSGVVLFEVENEERVDAALMRLAQVAERWAGEAADGRFQSRVWSHRGTPCFSLAFPGLPVPVEISYALSDGWLVIAASPGTLRAALEQSRRDTDLLDREGIPAELVENLGEMTGAGFFDAETFARQGFGTASLVANGLANAARLPEDPTAGPGELLPMYGDVKERAGVWTTIERIQGKDLVSLTRFDRSWVVTGTSLLGTPLSLSLTAPFAAGFTSSAIEYLYEAREAANRRRIAWGMGICQAALEGHSDRVGGKYPVSLEELVAPESKDRGAFPGGLLPHDPWGRPFEYERSPFREDQARLGCLGSDGVEGGEGDAADVWIELGTTSS